MASQFDRVNATPWPQNLPLPQASDFTTCAEAQRQAALEKQQSNGGGTSEDSSVPWPGNAISPSKSNLSLERNSSPAANSARLGSSARKKSFQRTQLSTVPDGGVLTSTEGDANSHSYSTFGSRSGSAGNGVSPIRMVGNRGVHTPTSANNTNATVGSGVGQGSGGKSLTTLTESNILSEIIEDDNDGDSLVAPPGYKSNLDDVAQHGSPDSKGHGHGSYHGGDEEVKDERKEGDLNYEGHFLPALSISQRSSRKTISAGGTGVGNEDGSPLASVRKSPYPPPLSAGGGVEDGNALEDFNSYDRSNSVHSRHSSRGGGSRGGAAAGGHHDFEMKEKEPRGPPPRQGQRAMALAGIDSNGKETGANSYQNADGSGGSSVVVHNSSSENALNSHGNNAHTLPLLHDNTSGNGGHTVNRIESKKLLEPLF